MMRKTMGTGSFGHHFCPQPALRGPGRNLRARIEAEFVQDVLDVRVGGALGNDKRRRNLPVRLPVGYQRGNLALPRREDLAVRSPSPPRLRRFH